MVIRTMIYMIEGCALYDKLDIDFLKAKMFEQAQKITQNDSLESEPEDKKDSENYLNEVPR